MSHTKNWQVKKLLQQGFPESKIISGFVEVNRETWLSLGVPEDVVWKPEHVEAQIRNCPHMLYCTMDGNRIVATISSIHVHEDDALSCTSWYDMSGGGTLTTHDPSGDCAFGLDLSVHPDYQSQGISDSLIQYGFFRSVVLHGKKGVFLGSRLPGFSKRPAGFPVERYVYGHDLDGRTLDPEIRLYKKSGFKIMKIIPGYMPDPASRDYGVLMFYPNPLYKITKHLPRWMLSNPSAPSHSNA